MRVKVFYNQKAEGYGLKFNAGDGKVLYEDNFDSIENEICEIKFVEQNENTYLFGATPNSNWFGVKCSKERFDSWQNKFNLFENLIS